MNINQVHYCDWMENEIPDKSVQLIIADPPYFEVKGDFDFQWASFKAYLIDVKRWARECKRILADNDSLFWYGDRKNIAHCQVILDSYFTFENHIYWQKATASYTEQWDTLRSFYTRGYERILFYSNVDVYNLTPCVIKIRDYIRGELDRCKGIWSLKDVNTILGTATNGGGVASACLSLDKLEPAMFTEELYTKLQAWCSPHFMTRPYKELRAEYQTLKDEYESKRRPFNNFMKLSDHWNFTIGETNSIDHPTPKPEKMTRAMIFDLQSSGRYGRRSICRKRNRMRDGIEGRKEVYRVRH